MLGGGAAAGVVVGLGLTGESRSMTSTSSAAAAGGVLGKGAGSAPYKAHTEDEEAGGGPPAGAFGVSTPYMANTAEEERYEEDDEGLGKGLGVGPMYSTSSLQSAKSLRALGRKGEAADAELALRRNCLPAALANFPKGRVPQAAATWATSAGSLSPVVELLPFLRQ